MSYAVVYVPDSAPPVCSEFPTREQLCEYLAGLPAEYGFCYVFADARRLQVSSAVPRYLVDGAEVIPLHPAPTTPETVELADGRLGPPLEGTDPTYANLTPHFDDDDID
jgi:hypothetical protein